MRSRAFAAIVLAVSGLTTATAAYASPPHHFKSSERTICNGLPISQDRVACRIGYTFCRKTAKETVSAYYNGRGASLDTLETRYARSIYGPGFERAGSTGAFEGCGAALMDEYDYLYG